MYKAGPTLGPVAGMVVMAVPMPVFRLALPRFGPTLLVALVALVLFAPAPGSAEATAQPAATAAASAPAADGAPAPAASAASAPTHRSLRKVIPFGTWVPTEPEVFRGYPQALPYTVVPRKSAILLYPCNMCHNLLPPPDLRVRKLRAIPDPKAAPHQATLRHGGGRFWCNECHFVKDREFLRTLDNKKLSFDESPALCGQCHGQQHRDWAHGAHGKRVAGWTGERQLYACTHCHDPHEPKLDPRAPAPPPPLRAGLKPMPRHPHAAASSPWPGAEPPPPPSPGKAVASPAATKP